MRDAAGRARWGAITLPLGALCLLAYCCSEWLFVVTKPSALATLPLSTQLAVLLRAPLPALWPALIAQAIATAIAGLGYPRLRAVAVVPGALVLAVLGLLLIDNFTYTLGGFGVLTSRGLLRVAYAPLLTVLAVIAGDRLLRCATSCARVPQLSAVALVLTGLLALAPLWSVEKVVQAAPVDTAAPPAPGQSAGASMPNILILGIDGVDADELSAYGYERETSPYLEHLRDESLFFENAFSNVGRTHGSLVALLTGRLPFSTGVTFPPTALEGGEARQHLLGLLKPRGYTSLQLGMRHYADAEDANLLGFDAANYRWQNLDDIQTTTGPDETTVFRRDLAERLNQRLAHLFGWQPVDDVHAHVEGTQVSPYWKDARRVETLTRYLPTAPEPWLVHTHFLDTHCCAYHPNALTFSSGNTTRDALDSVLREADEHVRMVMAALEASGRLERTIVVIMSDHTNGWTTRGRVPLMIRFPGGAHAGRVRANVQVVDVVPTLLDYLDEPVPDWVDGASLLDPAVHEHSRPIFGVSEIEGRHAVGFMTTALDDAGPPNYGAGTVTLISGAKWYELSLRDGQMAAGDVPGHTAPELPSLDAGEARAALMRQLTSAGFVLAPTSH